MLRITQSAAIQNDISLVHQCLFKSRLGITEQKFSFSSYKILTKVMNKNTTHSSEWIRRQLADRYVRNAQFENYRSRSAYKLLQLDDRFCFIRKNQIIIDLGSYPGGWAQVVIARSQAGNGESSSRVIAIDKIKIQEIPHLKFIQGDVCSLELLDQLRNELSDQRVDLILSDISPPCTGIKQEDHLSSVDLSLKAAEFTENILKLSGTFVVKVFMGSEIDNFKTYLKSRFQTVRITKPKASRKESSEIYFVCQNFIGRPKISTEVMTKGSFSTREGY